MTRTALFALALLLTASAHATTNILPDACGKDDVKFDVKTEKSQPADSASAQNAQIVFIETLHKASNVLVKPTVRLGLDGNWAGAVKANSYFVVSVPAGEHHLCASWQSHFKSFRDNTAATSITVEPGKTYFVDYDVNLIATEGGATPVTNFALINDDQGKFFLKSYPHATWTTKQ